MNVDHENTELGTVAPAHESPGEMLKRAREAKKLSHIDVAKQLKLRVQWILDIENDHYTDASALIYVRGYLRAYARVVSVSPDEVMSVFDLMKFEEPFVARKAQLLPREEQFVMHQPVLSYTKSNSNKGLGKKIWGWIILIIVLLALTLAIMWWRSEHNLQNASRAGASPQVALPTAPQTSLR
ncbi:MAG: hypothetical protein A3F10_01055 [Coxiella sp. RIFCSPHIGHO2_12_FULL_42_15]|nr:MAG: hypothetical protein A3F10_01055 [Coxiella sp. RIFCSPHIGHO2_12_FULL_42_15]